MQHNIIPRRGETNGLKGVGKSHIEETVPLKEKKKEKNNNNETTTTKPNLNRWKFNEPFNYAWIK